MVSPGPCRQFLLCLLLAGPPCLFWRPLHVPPHKPLWTHTLAAPRSHAQQSHTSTQVSTALAQVHPSRPHCREAPLLEHSPWDSSSPTTCSMQLLPPTTPASATVWPVISSQGAPTAPTQACNARVAPREAPVPVPPYIPPETTPHIHYRISPPRQHVQPAWGQLQPQTTSYDSHQESIVRMSHGLAGCPFGVPCSLWEPQGQAPTASCSLFAEEPQTYLQPHCFPKP